jgi:hypothetical protein
LLYYILKGGNVATLIRFALASSGAASAIYAIGYAAGMLTVTSVAGGPVGVDVIGEPLMYQPLPRDSHRAIRASRLPEFPDSVEMLISTSPRGNSM